MNTIVYFLSVCAVVFLATTLLISYYMSGQFSRYTALKYFNDMLPSCDEQQRSKIHIIARDYNTWRFWILWPMFAPFATVSGLVVVLLVGRGSVENTIAVASLYAGGAAFSWGTIAAAIYVGGVLCERF